MAGVRALHRRLKRMEKAEKPKPSLITVWFGSFDKFVDATYPEIIVGKLSDEFYDIIDALRGWEQLDSR